MTRYSPILEESYQVVKAPGAAWVTRPSGQRLTLTDYSNLTKETARSRFGAFPPDYHGRLSRAGGQEQFQSAVYYHPDVDWQTLSRRLFGRDEAKRREAQAELREAIAEQSALLSTELESRGVKVLSAGKSIPSLLISGSAADTLTLSSLNAVRLIASGDPMVPVQYGTPQSAGCNTVGATDHVVHHNIDIFNDTLPDGHFGAGQRIGIVEDIGDWRIDDGHVAFHQPVMHQQTSPSGNVEQHATAVASIISPNHAGGTRGAGLAELYYPNEGAPTPFGSDPAVICTIDGLANAYHWLADEYEVPTVNESTGCIHPALFCSLNEIGLAGTFEGLTQDYYARVYGTTIVKAAGTSTFPCEDMTKVACPFTLNSV